MENIKSFFYYFHRLSLIIDHKNQSSPSPPPLHQLLPFTNTQFDFLFFIVSFFHHLHDRLPRSTTNSCHYVGHSHHHSDHRRSSRVQVHRPSIRIREVSWQGPVCTMPPFPCLPLYVLISTLEKYKSVLFFLLQKHTNTTTKIPRTKS